MAMAQKYGYGDPGFGSSGQRKGRKYERVMELSKQGHEKSHETNNDDNVLKIHKNPII